jgi:hypothetical protein
MMEGDLPPGATPTDDGPGFLLWEAANGWQRNRCRCLEEIGLTHVQFALLSRLGRLNRSQGIPITLAVLA